MQASFQTPDTDTSIPGRLDCETAALVRGFLGPIFARAQSWPELCSTLDARGYALEFRDGRLVVISRDFAGPLCTGRDLGHPLSELAARLGRPQLKLAQGGRKGWLA
ncbi:hypothetical protein SAMN05421853_101294 [Roseivivax halotolerans]|uniref:Uncharacterized protein n=1 Tax=Roseivivax halotolerans TaxID=93684 RepID=A0A1I5V2A6_9RHOB|nr:MULTISPECIES: hypothetical protein [Roseivivax]QFT64786.1 hypothetical protein FIU91_17745 [Roseivivax sp. THAF30]SFQ01645.1 hypothetical protein SAMN05421853_101294 [Roseivivax halotolerans]